MNQAVRANRSLYEADEHLWIQEQVAALRSGRLDQLDTPHLIEFLDDTARRDRHELRSRLAVLLIHLLKVRYQPERLSRSWIRTVLTQQREIGDILAEAPSLAQHGSALLQQAYENGLRAVARETGLPMGTFPRTCPWTVQEALAFDPPEPPARRP